jgi:O-antigen ligase
MQFTDSVQPYSRVLRRAALVALLAVAFLSLPMAADPYQPVRALVSALALVVALLAAPEPPRSIPRWVLAASAALVVWYAIAAILGEPASSLWGVHGRFQGLVSFSLAWVAALTGWLAFRNDVRWIARVAAAAAALQGTIVVWQALTGGIPVGTIGNRALLGAWLAVATTGAIASWRIERDVFRWVAFACASVGAVGLGLAGSRGAWLALAVGAGVVVIAGGIKKGWPVVVLGVVLVVAALGLGGESAQKLDPVALAGGSASSRVEIWRGTAALIADNTVVGVGPGRFLYEFPQYQGVEHVLAEGPDVRPDQAHSYVLQMASDAGILAAALLISLAGAALAGGVRGVRDKNPSALAALAMFSAYVTQAIFGIGTVETDILGWMLGGILVGMLATSDATAWSVRARWVGAGVAALLAILAAYYLVGDISHGRGLDAYSAAQFEAAYDRHSSAVTADPLVDIYRVGQADAALFIGGSAIGDAATSAERGLEFEPMSFDLALSRARLVAAGGGTVDEVADAYMEAVELYPLGIGVRLETAVALLQASRVAEARQMAEDVLLIVPENPDALAILEAATDG